MKKALLATAVASMASTLALNAAAADIRWNGFASVTGGISTGEGTRGDGEELRLYGYDDDFNFRPESKLALQASSDLSDGLSVTAQAIARGSDDFNVEMEWAFISYDFGEASRINLGKLRVPLYQYSDFLDVGYAYPWIRPPESVYDLFFSTLEGVNLQLNGALGSWDSGLQLVAGRTSNQVAISEVESDAELRNFLGGVWTVSNDSLTLRAAYFQAETTISNASLDLVADTLADAGFADQSTNFAVDGDTGTFASVGFKFDNGNWFFAGEVTQLQVPDSFVAEQDSAYVTLGKTFNDLQFLVTYEEQEDTLVEGITTGIPVPPSLCNPAGSPTEQFACIVAGAEQAAASTEGVNSTITVGMRYNFHPSASFKIEYSQREFDTDATLAVDGDASVVRFSIDTVF